MLTGPHAAHSAAWVARAIDFLGLGTPSLVWAVDLIAQPVTEEEWRGYLGRLRDALQNLPSGTNPVVIRMRYVVDGHPVEADLHLPLPDVAAGFIPLCGGDPPIGCWRIEVAGPGQMATHRGGGPTVPPDFGQDVPF